MFSGLIADLGTVESVEAGAEGARLRIATALAGEIAAGDSVAVNGVCLTAVSAGGRRLRRRGDQPDARPDLAGGAASPATGSTSSWRCAPPTGSAATSSRATSTAPARSSRSPRTASRAASACASTRRSRRYMVERGSVALDGVSLTVAGARRGLDRGGADPRDDGADEPRSARPRAGRSTSSAICWPSMWSACCHHWRAMTKGERMTETQQLQARRRGRRTARAPSRRSRRRSTRSGGAGWSSSATAPTARTRATW